MVLWVQVPLLPYMFEIKKEKLSIDEIRKKLKKSINDTKRLNKDIRKGKWKPNRSVVFY